MSRGIVALGDSITRGKGGAPTLGVHPQSWVQWLAEALDLPLHNLAVDGATAPDVVSDQLHRAEGARHASGAGPRPHALATLHVGANDARGPDFDAARFEAAVDLIVTRVAAVADHVLVLTVPLDLGRPRAGTDVATANAALRRVAAEHDALTCGLDALRGPRVLLPDAVHPTAPGMVAIAGRAAVTLAAAGLPVPVAPATLAGERTDAAARARHAAWWLRQLARDHVRRARERAG